MKLSRLCFAAWTFALLLVGALPARAHVGSKDVFEQVTVGPYKLFVTVRPPMVIPGVAQVEVRSYGAPVDSLTITPTPIIGEASKHPPTPDAMTRSTTDPQFFTGSVWIMASGSWEVRFRVSGAAGEQKAAVPVPAVSLTVLKMQKPLGVALGVLGLVLALGVAGIVAAAVREARLEPGVAPDEGRRRGAAWASVAALVVVAGAVMLANKWWNVEAADYASGIYRPLDLHPALSGNVLQLAMGYQNEKKHRWQVIDDLKLLPDHGHLMHLYFIRWPQMDAVYHLHPAIVLPGVMRDTLPSMPPGEYHLYADIVTQSGFPETLTASVTVPVGMPGGPLDLEDAAGTPPPLNAGALGDTYNLPDGYSMIWERPASLQANAATIFKFRLVDAQGRPATEMQPYLGMAGHAAFVKTDGTVFAHTHPEGSAAMPAVMLANAGSGGGMAGMDTESPKPELEFPYGFPTAGKYRIFIQMKHAATVETGVFDAQVR